MTLVAHEFITGEVPQTAPGLAFGLIMISAACAGGALGAAALALAIRGRRLAKLRAADGAGPLPAWLLVPRIDAEVAASR